MSFKYSLLHLLRSFWSFLMKKKVGGKPSKSGGGGGDGGGSSPAKLEITILKTFFLVWSWILQYMIETSFSSIISKKPGEIPIFRTFWTKKINLGLYFTVDRQFGQTQQLWRHCDDKHGMFVLFWYVWKEKTHSYTMVPNKHTSLQAFIFQVHRAGGCNNSPSPWLVRRYKK